MTDATPPPTPDDDNGFTVTLPYSGSPNRVIPWWELQFSADTSGGPGGQHANRSSTRISLYWRPGHSSVFNEQERGRLTQALRARLDGEGTLRIRMGNERSQSKNKQACLDVLAELIREALKPRRRRVPTRPSRASKKRRVENKRRRSQVKSQRQRPRPDE